MSLHLYVQTANTILLGAKGQKNTRIAIRAVFSCFGKKIDVYGLTFELLNVD